MADEDKTSFSATHFGDYQIDKRQKTVTQGISYPRILEGRVNKEIDLSKGLNEFKNEYGTEKYQLHSLLTFIEQTAKPGQTLREVVQSVEFVCGRGLLKYLLRTRSKGPSNVLAARFNGIIFMCSAEEKYDKRQNRIKGIYYGAKFQQIMTDRLYYRRPVTNEKLSKTVLRGVFENSRGKHTVLYSAQVNGIDSNDKKVELKIYSGTLDDGFWIENRSMIWFMQAYLTNIDTIHVGERTDNILTKTYPLNTSKILSMANDKWSKDECLNFLHTTLSELKKCLPIDGTAKIIKFEDGSISSTDVEMSSILIESFMRRFGPQT